MADRPLDLDAIRHRSQRYLAQPHATRAMASASDVPALLDLVSRLAAERDAARLDLARLTAPQPDPYERCGDCLCCTAAGCHTGPGSGCPTSSRTGEYACPCTGG